MAKPFSPDFIVPCHSRLPEFLRDCGVPAPSRLSSRWTKVGGMRLHSRGFDRERTIPFVLIHGLVISSLYMIPLAECLALQHAVYALDLPGFGRSEGRARALSVSELAQSVCGWLDEMGIEGCHLVANSLGCQICAHVAAARPRSVISLTLIGATIDPAARSFLVQAFRLLKDACREPAKLWVNWLFDFGRAGLRRAVGTVHGMFLDRIEQSLPAIAAPTLIIRGAGDPTMPMRWAQEAAASMSSARTFVIEGAAHCAHYSRPGPVAAALCAHALSAEHSCASFFGGHQTRQ